MVRKCPKCGSTNINIRQEFVRKKGVGKRINYGDGKFKYPKYENVYRYIATCQTCHHTYTPRIKTEEIATIAPASAEGCYIATCVYGNYDCPEVWLFRRYRDTVLKKSFLGRSFITLYYSISPHLVKRFGNSKIFKGFFKSILNTIYNRLMSTGFSNTEYLGK